MNVSQAKDRMRDATAAVAQASQDLEDTREAVSFKEATERDVTKASRQLQRAQDREAQAKTDLSVATRAEAAEQADRDRESARIKAALAAINRQKAAAESEKYRLWLLGVRSDLDAFNRELARLEQAIGYRSIPYPSRFGSFTILNSAVTDQLFHFTKPVNYGTQEG